MPRTCLVVQGTRIMRTGRKQYGLKCTEQKLGVENCSKHKKYKMCKWRTPYHSCLLKTQGLLCQQPIRAVFTTGTPWESGVHILAESPVYLDHAQQKNSMSRQVVKTRSRTSGASAQVSHNVPSGTEKIPGGDASVTGFPDTFINQSTHQSRYRNGHLMAQLLSSTQHNIPAILKSTAAALVYDLIPDQICRCFFINHIRFEMCRNGASARGSQISV